MGEIIFGFISGEVAVLLEKIEEKNHQKLKMFRYLSHLWLLFDYVGNTLRALWHLDTPRDLSMGEECRKILHLYLLSDTGEKPKIGLKIEVKLKNKIKKSRCSSKAKPSSDHVEKKKARIKPPTFCCTPLKKIPTHQTLIFMLSVYLEDFLCLCDLLPLIYFYSSLH